MPKLTPREKFAKAKERVNKAYMNLQNLVKEEQSKCKHMNVIYAKYEESKFFWDLYPAFFVCKDCGLKEVNPGITYFAKKHASIKFKHVDFRCVPELPRDEAKKLIVEYEF